MCYFLILEIGDRSRVDRCGLVCLHTFFFSDKETSKRNHHVPARGGTAIMACSAMLCQEFCMCYFPLKKIRKISSFVQLVVCVWPVPVLKSLPANRAAMSKRVCDCSSSDSSPSDIEVAQDDKDTESPTRTVPVVANLLVFVVPFGHP